jgi:hypothetical protein
VCTGAHFCSRTLPPRAPLPALPSTLQPATLLVPLQASVELQECDVSELLLATLLRLQQELVLGAARALRLHGSSSLNKPPPFYYLTTVMHTMIWFAVTQRLRYFAALAINHSIVSMPCNTPSS